MDLKIVKARITALLGLKEEAAAPTTVSTKP
jgi:hypothetical protein